MHVTLCHTRSKKASCVCQEVKRATEVILSRPKSHYNYDFLISVNIPGGLQCFLVQLVSEPGWIHTKVCIIHYLIIFVLYMFKFQHQICLSSHFPVYLVLLAELLHLSLLLSDLSVLLFSAVLYAVELHTLLGITLRQTVQLLLQRDRLTPDRHTKPCIDELNY